MDRLNMLFASFRAVEEQIDDQRKGIAYENVDLRDGEPAVYVPATTDNDFLRPLLEQAAILSGRGGIATHMELPAVRLVGSFTLASAFGGTPIAGLMLHTLGEVWLNRDMMAGNGDLQPIGKTADEARHMFDSVIVHELVHYLQFMDDPFRFKADTRAVYLQREVEAFQTQWRYLQRFGLDLMPYIKVSRYEDIPAAVDHFYAGMGPAAVVWIDRFDQLQDTSWSERRMKMLDRGWLPAGSSGSRATVYSHEKLGHDIVVKLGRYDRRTYQPYRKHDAEPIDAYLHYVRKFVAEGGSIFLPRISTIIRYPQFYVAVMERLYRYETRDKVEQVQSSPALKPLLERLEFETTIQVWPHLAELFREPHWDLASHTSNIMHRADGTPVVTDPFF